jgi:hypothetical protein
MASGPRDRRGGDKPIGVLMNELVEMIVAYVKQETITPIRSLGRYIAFGVAGGLLIAMGGGLLILAAVRAAQVEAGSHLKGDLSWVPYVGGILLGAFGVGWAVSRMVKGPR